ncbi:hypothetical protein SFRURICE_013648, partial [Spodoptera frugiperda]
MSSSKTRSPIWQYFDLNSDDNKYAVCLLCHVKISRGGEGKKAGTSAMSNHLKSKHPEEFKLINKKKTEQALPRYELPSRTYISQKIVPDIYNRIHDKIKTNISKAIAVSVTSDIWTCLHNSSSFLSFTAHWLSPEFQLQHGYLDKNETAQRTPDLARMRASLKAELESRFKSLGDNPNYLIATFLDPRFKSDYLGVLETEKARQKIMIEYIKNSCEESSSD